METKNEILLKYAGSLVDATNAIFNSVATLGEDADVNLATIRTINVLAESLRSQTVIFQNAVDEYKPISG